MSTQSPPLRFASTLAVMTRVRLAELSLLGVALLAQALLFARPIHSATNYDEGVYLAALDALRHGQALGSSVFAAQFPGFYELLRGLSFLTGVGVVAVRAGLIAVTLAGTVGGWLVGRRFGGPTGGLLVAALLVVAPPLDLFSFQVIADTPALALTALALGIATLPGTVAAVAAGALFGAALSVKLTALTAAPAAIWLIRRRLGPAIAGFAGLWLALLIAHAGALGDLWSSGITYHDRARSTPAVIPHPHRQILDQIPHSTPFFWLAIVAVVVAVAFFALRRPLHVWPLWSWVVLALAFLLLHKPLHYNHLVEFPFTLAVAAGATLGAALEAFRPPLRAALVGLVALALVAAFVQQWHRTSLVLGHEPPSNLAAAHALDRLTARGALVIDDRPIISFLAHRRVVGPVVDMALLRWETGSLTDARVIDQLPKARAVVVSRALRSRPVVLAYIRSHYTRRFDGGGVQIWTR